MGPWLIMTGSGFDDWIYWHLHVQFLVITINCNNSQSSAEPFFLDCRGLVPFSFSFYNWLLIYDRNTYIISRWTHPLPSNGYTCVCEPQRKHCFLCCCIYSALHRNGSYLIVACVSIVAYCCRLYYLATGCLPRICLRRNVFTELLPSNRYTCHNNMGYTGLSTGVQGSDQFFDTSTLIIL